ncbi:MAG: prepilin-type N-terminal cleavage/methylation domain-containing protein [Alphaproteobacteria bacterium]|nr:prepilin-type N-terminal cleavage/methylation domain-containing protein [Alphaproteobacteria bacterium]
MKKYSKGTTLIEIMISIALISVVMIFVFNILSDLKDEDRESSKNSTDLLNKASYTRIIQNDFINLDLQKIQGCSDANSIVCYLFTYQTGTTKKFIVYSNYIVYGDEKWTLTSGNYTKQGSKFCYEQSDNSIKPYHLLKIYVPTDLDVSSNKNYDVELTDVRDYYLTISNLTIDNNTKRCD